MWKRFTERARKVVFHAQEEACKLGESHVATEHLLLGLVYDQDSLAVRALGLMGVSREAVRSEIDKHVHIIEGKLESDMQLTPRAKRVIDLAYEESRDLRNKYIGTEHLLLALIREKDGLAARILGDLGITYPKTKEMVTQVHSGNIDAGGDYCAGRSIDRINSAGLSGSNLLSIADLSKAQINAIFDETRLLKNGIVWPQQQRKILEGKTLAMIFEKPSLRTRVSFETGIFQLGGHGIYLGPSDISLGKRESVADVARTLGRMSDIIMARVFAHDAVVGLGKHAGVPVINGLSDLEHPCQALADFYTILERKGKFEGLKVAFIGDGNNVAHSLMLLAAKLGTHFAIGCPQGYEPDPKVIDRAKAFAKETHAKIEICHDPVDAVHNADVVYTDVWASMGQESEAAEREKIFAPYQVNTDLMMQAKPDAIFEHCLPAHRGSEVTDEVIDSPQSVVFDEAENRLQVQKSVMALLAG